MSEFSEFTRPCAITSRCHLICRFLAAVETEAKHHFLDTFAAMISGSTLGPGQFMREYVRAEGGSAEAHLVNGTLLSRASLPRCLHAKRNCR